MMKLFRCISSLWLICLTLLAVGCAEDMVPGSLSPDEEGEGAVTLTLNVSIVNSGAGGTRAGEIAFEPTNILYEKINTLRVIIVRENNVVEHNRLVRMPDGIGVDRIGELDFKVSTDLAELVQNPENSKWYRTEKKQIYLVANEASIPSEPTIVGEVKNLLWNLKEGETFTSEAAEKLIIFNEWSDLTGSTESEVKTDKIASPFIDNEGFAKKYVPMTEFFEVSVTENVSDGKTKQQHEENLFITRALVKFRFSIDATDGTYPFKVTNIIFNKVMQKEYLFPNNTVYDPPKYSDGKVLEVENREITKYTTPPFAGDKDEDRDGNQVRPYIFVPTNFGFNGGSKLPALDLPADFINMSNTYTPELYFCETRTLDGDEEHASLFSVGIEIEFPWDADGNSIMDAEGNRVGEPVKRVFEPQNLDNLLTGLPRNTIVDVKMSISDGELNAIATVFPYTAVSLHPEFGVIVEPTGVTLDRNEVSMAETTSVWLGANITPEDATETTLKWSSSDDSIATVNDEGMITAVKAGEATITVETVNGHKASCKVTVTAEIKATAIELDQTTASVAQGNTLSLYAKLIPGNVTNRALTWSSSNTAVANVDEEGVVTALSPGTTAITATTSNGVNATCNVTVTQQILPTAISLTPTTLNITVGNTGLLYSTITPANATNTNLEWSSSNNSVATVTAGNVTAVSPGSATITAKTSNGLTATCAVNVTGTNATTISLNKQSATLGEGGTLYLEAFLSANATNKTLIWSSSDNKVATVDNGFVTGVAPGSATITVSTSTGLKATCNVTVINVALDKTKATLKVGEHLNLQATLTPNNVSNVRNIWSSSDTNVATVDDNGGVTTKQLGNAIITVTIESTTEKVTQKDYVYDTAKKEWVVKETLVPAVYSSANCEITVGADTE